MFRLAGSGDALFFLAAPDPLISMGVMFSCLHQGFRTTAQSLALPSRTLPANRVRVVPSGAMAKGTPGLAGPHRAEHPPMPERFVRLGQAKWDREQECGSRRAQFKDVCKDQMCAWAQPDKP